MASTYSFACTSIGTLAYAHLYATKSSHAIKGSSSIIPELHAATSPSDHVNMCQLMHTYAPFVRRLSQRSHIYVCKQLMLSVMTPVLLCHAASTEMYIHTIACIHIVPAGTAELTSHCGCIGSCLQSKNLANGLTTACSVFALVSHARNHHATRRQPAQTDM